MAESATLTGDPATELPPGAPLHCGAPMQWTSPEPAMPSYSFGPADPSLDLPALWRCPCGFQLDGGIQLGDGLHFADGFQAESVFQPEVGYRLGGIQLDGGEQGVDQAAAGLAAAC
ncbi:hypothetical protein [Arthrobacter humicola]|uniref:hypothetical protein n=1 Tax=Arthrobacter humicola TaxID=409291 RepID=UPI001FAB6673|nr:hypothetical protein [Arthrobacter humicola]MCI9870336.1 hypothetical protein [Arthrobacter humicola]